MGARGIRILDLVMVYRFFDKSAETPSRKKIWRIECPQLDKANAVPRIFQPNQRSARKIQHVIGKIREYAHHGAGVLIADHHYPDLIPISEHGYLMQNKQCRGLARTASISAQLRDFGYLSQLE
jgi:hypothetical protein